MSSLLARAVVVSVHGHKQLSSAPVDIHLRATQAQDDWQAAAHEKMAQLPVMLLLVANFCLFIPAILYVGYTLGTVLPTLASVESSEGSYEPIPVQDDLEVDGKGEKGFSEKGSSKTVPEAEEAGAIKRRPITSSIRATQKHLCSASPAGWRALFSGFSLSVVIHFLAVFITGLVMSVLPGVPAMVPLFLADVVLVQLHTALVHAIVSPSALSWWRRLPPFVETLKATFLPICATVLAAAAVSGVPFLTLLALGRPVVEREVGPGFYVRSVEKKGVDAIIYFALSFGLLIFVACPAQVVLTRVQASLLPDSDETIVPFDRSLGRTSPNPSAFQRMVDAYKSFSGSWVRFYKLIAKTFVVTLAVIVTIGAVAGLEGVVGTLAG